MNPPLTLEWLNARLDEELSPDDRAAADARLAANPAEQEEFTSLRELDDLLRRHIVAPEFQEAGFLAELERRHSQARWSVESATTAPGSLTAGRVTPGQGGRSVRSSKIFAVTAAVVVLATIGLIAFVQQWTDTPKSAQHVAQIARIVRFVGQIEMQRPTETAWQQMGANTASAVMEGTKLRTLPMSLCEVETTASGVLRLNENTELIVRKAAEIELVSGEFWCSSSGNSKLTVFVPGKLRTEENGSGGNVIPSFVCPTNSPTQWTVSESEIKCLSLSDSVAELTSSSRASCSVEPGQWISIGDAEMPTISGYANRLIATAWQLPLLAVGRPDDPELQSLLQSMLENLGRAKVSSLYASQIRSLGPSGTIPLIAFVRSPKSLENPHQRHEAMRIIADLAPESARSDLEVLSSDNDSIVSELALAALARLAGRSKG